MKNFTHCLDLISMHSKGFRVFCCDHDSRFLPDSRQQRENRTDSTDTKALNTMKAKHKKVKIIGCKLKAHFFRLTALSSDSGCVQLFVWRYFFVVNFLSPNN